MKTGISAQLRVTKPPQFFKILLHSIPSRESEKRDERRSNFNTLDPTFVARSCVLSAGNEVNSNEDDPCSSVRPLRLDVRHVFHQMLSIHPPLQPD